MTDELQEYLKEDKARQPLRHAGYELLRMPDSGLKKLLFREPLHLLDLALGDGELCRRLLKMVDVPLPEVVRPSLAVDVELRPLGELVQGKVQPYLLLYLM